VLKIPAFAKRQNVGGQLRTTAFIENIVLTTGRKSLSLKVTLTVEFAMSVVGVATFSSLVTMMLIQNFTTMIDKIKSVAVGVALVGRMVPNSIL
jgi:hypothetical protein